MSSVLTFAKAEHPRRSTRIGRLISVAALLAPTVALAAAWQNHAAPWTPGPSSYYGVPLHSLAVVPGEWLFAAGANQLHVSRDDGVTWTQVATPAGSIAAVTNTRTQPAILYATNVTEWGAFTANLITVLRSTDAGRSWTSVASNTRCFRLVLGPAGTPAYCFDAGYVASFYPALFRSGDSGASWLPAIGGTSWQPVYDGPLGAPVISVDTAGTTVHVASPASIHYSTDGGTSWQTPQSGPPGATSQIAVDRNRPAIAYVGSSDGLYKTQDDGRSWARIAFAFPVTAVAIDPADGVLYAGFQGGIARSRDGGATWQSVSNGLVDEDITVIDFAADKLYAVSVAGLSVCPGKDCGDALQPLADEVVEFYHADLDHFFYTANAGEQAWLDAGGAGGGWRRTGLAFRNGGAERVCRFYGSQVPGPNSHFYTITASECESLKELQTLIPASEKRWNYEGRDFFSTAPFDRDPNFVPPWLAPNEPTCPTGMVPVYRAYNNGFARGIDSNHRLTTSAQAIQDQVARGWKDEGIAMCAGQ
jgi:photosystem II stability/assembly factor-like uncharacterized protein